MDIYQNPEHENLGFSGTIVRHAEDPVLGYTIMLCHGCTNAWNDGVSYKLSTVYISGANERFPTLHLEGRVNPEDLASFYWEKLMAMGTPNDLRKVLKAVREAAVQHGRELVQGQLRAALGI